MLKNFLKIAYRNLLKKRVYTFINVLGLSVGAAASLLIFLYVRHEHSYDKFYRDTDQLYRVAMERSYPDRVALFSFIPGGYASAFKEEIPEIEKSTRLVGFPDFASVFRYNDVTFQEKYHFFADSNFFDVLDFKLVKGNPKTALKFANTVIVSESMAKKYFGSEDPIGKTLEIDTAKHEVVGVMQDIPRNSHLKFDFLSSSTAVGFLEEPNYYISSSYTYIKLANGVDPKVVEFKMPAVVEKYAAGQIERELGITFKDYQAAGNGYNYFLQPIGDIHLHSQLTNEIKPNGNITYVNILVFIGFLILLIAGINFVNLATARSTERAKEVGVRKVLGSRKNQLIYQFLSESMVISLLSIVIAIGLIQVTLGVFNSVIPTPVEFNLMDGFSALTVVSITLMMGLVAGLYPAFYISSLKPVAILKGKLHASTKGGLLRKGLIIFQFTISIVLISATLIVYQQLNFIQQKELGFDKENLLVIEHNGQEEEMKFLRQELERIPGVVSAGSSNANPGGYFFGQSFRQPGRSEMVAARGTTVDDNFNTALNLRVVAGRSFSPEFNDSLSLILNESAVRALGLTDPIGAKLENNFATEFSTYTVVGVVEDFNYESLHTNIAPLVLFSTEGQYNFSSVITVRLEPNSLATTLASIEAKWKELLPGDPFLYSFLDSNLDKMYSSERTSGEILAIFTSIAIMIACFGLFGLAAYAANQRTKEIGVRKVLGATVPSILNLLSRDFTKLVIISFVIGCPIAYFAMNQWLQSFAYRTPLGISSFLASGLLILLITYFTISYQALKAATANPVNSLKEE